MEDAIKKLQSALNKLAKGEGKIEEIKCWVKTMVDPKTKLIEFLLKLVIAEWDGKRDLNELKKYMSTIRLLLDNIPEVVSQIEESTIFIRTIGNYIETVAMEEFTGDEFVILSYLAQGKRIGEAKSKGLVQKLFDSLEYLKHPAVFNAIVSLIINISCELSEKSKEENYVIKMCGNHDTSRYIEEILIQLINKPNPDFTMKYLQFAIEAFKSTETRNSFYYINDVNVLLDTLIRDIDSTKIKELRMKYFELIKEILNYPEYLKFKYKWDDVKLAMTDMASNKDIDEETINKCNEILKYMETQKSE